MIAVAAITRAHDQWKEERKSKKKKQIDDSFACAIALFIKFLSNGRKELRKLCSLILIAIGLAMCSMWIRFDSIRFHFRSIVYGVFLFCSVIALSLFLPHSIL